MILQRFIQNYKMVSERFLVFFLNIARLARETSSLVKNGQSQASHNFSTIDPVSK